MRHQRIVVLDKAEGGKRELDQTAKQFVRAVQKAWLLAVLGAMLTRGTACFDQQKPGFYGSLLGARFSLGAGLAVGLRDPY